MVMVEECGGKKEVKAVAHIKSNTTWRRAPSKAYLEAYRKNTGEEIKNIIRADTLQKYKPDALQYYFSYGGINLQKMRHLTGNENL